MRAAQLKEKRQLLLDARIDTQAKLKSLQRMSNFVAFCAKRLVIARGKSQHAHCKMLKAVTFDDIVEARMAFAETGRSPQLANTMELADAIPQFYKIHVKAQPGPITVQCKVEQRQGKPGAALAGGAGASDLIIYLSTSTSDPSAADNEMKFVATNRSKFSFRFSPQNVAETSLIGKAAPKIPTTRSRSFKDPKDAKADAQQPFIF